jgi:hypothetical protein
VWNFLPRQFSEIPTSGVGKVLNPEADVMIFNCENIGFFLKLVFEKNNIVFWKKRNFFPKLAEIAEKNDLNIDPRYKVALCTFYEILVLDSYQSRKFHSRLLK